MASFLFIFILFFGCFTPVFASESAESEQQVIPESFRVTGYALPRFVSIRAEEAFVRTGPGTKYPVKWLIHQPGLPVEIVLEYDNWRKIRDYEGEEGWIHQSLLSGRRMALIKGEDHVPLFYAPDTDSVQKAFLEPLALTTLESCQTDWCHIESEGYEGWVERKYIWGIYEKEIFD